MLYLLKPKYNTLYQCENEAEVNEIMNSEGGVFVRFDRKPTDKERQRAYNNYYI